MIFTRKQRTNVFRKQTEHEWTEKFWKFIEDNLDKPWDWQTLSRNSMEIGKERWINQRRLRYIKALQIQRHWRDYSCNPEYGLARRLILKRLKD